MSASMAENFVVMPLLWFWCSGHGIFTVWGFPDSVQWVKHFS